MKQPNLDIARIYTHVRIKFGFGTRILRNGMLSTYLVGHLFGKPQNPCKNLQLFLWTTYGSWRREWTHSACPAPEDLHIKKGKLSCDELCDIRKCMHARVEGRYPGTQTTSYPGLPLSRRSSWILYCSSNPGGNEAAFLSMFSRAAVMIASTLFGPVIFWRGANEKLTMPVVNKP